MLSGCFPEPSGGAAGPYLPQHTTDLEGHYQNAKPAVRKFTFVRLVRSYWYDWVLISVLWGLLAVLNRTPGHKREFSLKDISIQHSHELHEHVPPFLLAVFSAFLPAGILLIVAIFQARNAWDVHNALCGLGVSWTMTGVVTQLVKMMVGRPRPDLIARCLPKEGARDHPVFGLSTVAICTNTDTWVVNDGFKSFPSGHSSLSFAGLGFLSFYLMGKCHLWDKYGHRNRAWFTMTPLLLAAMIAITRTEDNRHHWQDVLVGSALGLLISFISYRTYYPNLSNHNSHLPLLPRPAHGDGDEDDQELSTSPTGQNIRLLSEDGVPRVSEEETAWRANHE